MRIFSEISSGIPRGCVATVGVFDGVHRGHQYIVRQIKDMADQSGCEELVITMNPHPAAFFGRKISLLSTMDEKIALFERFGVRNLLVLNFNADIAALSGTQFIDDILVSRLSVSRLLLGYNNSIGHKENGVSEISSAQIPVSRLDRFHLDYSDDISSSTIRNLLSDGDIATANRYLGYKYCISGKVVHGRGVGHTIGFPTANIGIADISKVVPGNGAYVVSAEVAGRVYKGMLNIGYRPTFGGESQSIELHVLDCDGDLYGTHVKVCFEARLRGEQKFSDVDALVGQLGKDRDAVVSFFAENPLSL
ncbi:MAG: riboflavin biosynthesis protein RibF [Bacteroidales bacterium]|nr:riboflavin biosynthesis protein RibF [Bacteroidales bacterium]